MSRLKSSNNVTPILRRAGLGLLAVCTLLPLSLSLHAQTDISAWWLPRVAATTPAALYGEHHPARDCASLKTLALNRVHIMAAEIVSATASAPAICQVTAVHKRFDNDDPITVWLGLPLNNWNGRFMGIGGGGYAGGDRDMMAAHYPAGFATATTDAGARTSLQGRDLKPAAFALDAKGKLDWLAIRNFGHRGAHIMTVTGKKITEAFYGKPPKFSYFNGCSTGGRQALGEAQRYPQDYDGILAAAPATNAAAYIAGRVWGQMQMSLAKHFVPQCKFDAVTAAAVAACDHLDGVEDEVINQPRQCDYDPQHFVGSELLGCGVFSQADAQITRLIWQGPQRQDGTAMWYGYERGAPLGGVHGTEQDPQSGAWQTSQPWVDYYFSWHRYLLAQNPDLALSELSLEQFEDYWDQSLEQFTEVYSASNPDLKAFHQRGGKILVWHGETDGAIPPAGSIDYYQRVVAHFGSAAKAQEVLRLFMAPGVDHCAGGEGPNPVGVLDALIDWVEKNQAPEQLLAQKREPKTGLITHTRPLCLYPKAAYYKGQGSTDQADNFVCR